MPQSVLELVVSLFAQMTMFCENQKVESSLLLMGTWIPSEILSLISI